MDIDLRTLISRLDLSCRVALEGAAEKCIELKHSSVESEHFLDALLSHESSHEFRSLLSSTGIDVALIHKETQTILSEIPP